MILWINKGKLRLKILNTIYGKIIKELIDNKNTDNLTVLIRYPKGYNKYLSVNIENK